MSLLLDNVINIKENAPEQGANNLKCNIITPLFAQKMRKSCESKQKCCLPNNRVNKEAQKSRMCVCVMKTYVLWSGLLLLHNTHGFSKGQMVILLMYFF